MFAFVKNSYVKLSARAAEIWEAGPPPCWTDYLHQTRDKF
jgi:hypothetical protein